jgi:hypothetical protein
VYQLFVAILLQTQQQRGQQLVDNSCFSKRQVTEINLYRYIEFALKRILYEQKDLKQIIYLSVIYYFL